MSGLSLACGDCGVLLRSTKEAQDHAEVSGHSNFQESTQAVLNLVCCTCGKPCRSNEEVDLHKIRTGHLEFSDKTEESAKPLELEKAKFSGGSDITESGDLALQSEGAELVIPVVHEELKSELESMGFSEARAVRSLHFSGNTSVEAAVNWIVEHENDPDIDEMPKVSSSKEERSSLCAEEAKAKAKELLEKARKKKEEEEKRMEREREKERIRYGKEILEAKRIEEDQERKRIIAFRKAEKLEEKRAREKIKARIEEDRIERRRKLGLPLEEPPKSVEPPPEKASPSAEENRALLKVKPASKAEQLRSLLRELKHAHQAEDARVKTAFQTLMKFVANVALKPEEEKFRKIRVSNSAFQERVGSLKNGVEFLLTCGFKKDEGGENLWMAREDVDLGLLTAAGDELNKAITNPFFGMLK